MFAAKANNTLSARLGRVFPCHDFAGVRLWIRTRGPLWLAVGALLLLALLAAITIMQPSEDGVTGKVFAPIVKQPASTLEGMVVSPDADPVVPRAAVLEAVEEESQAAQQEAESQTPDSLASLMAAVDPIASVAFAIPVGGRTQRAPQLDDILRTLLAGGAPPENIFVMEDVEGRPGRINNADVSAVAAARGVRVVSSHVSRADMPETSSNFGIHLARHYKFMLDYLLVSPVEAGATGADADASSRGGRPFDFAVLVEDDLVLAPDFVKYFYAAARVMSVDSTLYCASAHQDNAFYGTAWEPADSGSDGSAVALDPLSFDFRRGNHFMAPGWMTSRRVYVDTVRPRWLDARGEYAFKAELKLRNGHWDRFFDSLTGDRDCLFPETPRIVHRGADGFTVDQRAQMELYSNLQLSRLPVSVDYGDLTRLTRSGYIASQLEFITSATRLTSLEESRVFRRAHLVYVVGAKSDRDESWNAVLNGFFGVIGVGGYGGYEGYVKVRGIFRGAVFVRWNTNLVLLVGTYSPYAAAVRARPIAFHQELTNGGCFRDRPGIDRDLPHYVAHYTPSTLTPRACVSSCVHLGFRVAGLQAGMECWCGDSFGRLGPVQPGDGRTCDATCDGGRVTGYGGADPIACGGAWLNSVYYLTQDGLPPTTPENAAALAMPLPTRDTARTVNERLVAAPTDAIYVRGERGQSCTDACAASSTPLRRVQCTESLFPLLHRNCGLLKSIIGCNTCREEDDIVHGVYSPGGVQNGACSLSKGRYLRCNAKPMRDEYERACVCEIVGGVQTQLKQQQQQQIQGQ